MALRVVLDTSIVVAGLRTRLGAANQALRLVAQSRLTVLATAPLFLEYEEVLQRPEHRLVHGLNLDEIGEFLSELAALIEPVELHFRLRPQLKDPKDEMVLEAAVNGRAHALVTYNTGDFLHAARRFRIPVLTPAQLFRKVGK